MIYLDNAATSFPKPRTVSSEVYNCINSYCGNPGRGTYSLSLKAAEKVYECRELVAKLLGCNCAENIIFTLNTTHAINMLLKGFLHKGDHIIISDMEHNSVYRPIYNLFQKGIIEYDIFHTNGNSHQSICSSILKLIKENTKMIMCIHSSNVCSMTMPLKDIANLCHKQNILFAVDAAQSAGHYDIDMLNQNIDAICIPGHKGLLGPQGCGILALNSKIMLETLVEGGNGVNSLDLNMPDFSPERYESGTMAVPAISGLYEGIKAIQQIGLFNIRMHSQMLFKSTYDMLSSIKGVKIYSPENVGNVLLFNVCDIPADLVAQKLSNYDICVRSGFHCSPLAHKTLQTPYYGAVRVSFGIYNTISDIEQLWHIVKEISTE